MREPTPTLTVEDFAQLFGVRTDTISSTCRALITKHDFRYRLLSPKEQNTLIQTINQKNDAHEFTRSGASAKERWQRGWEENMREFAAAGYRLAALTPKYIRKNRPVRLNGAYVMPVDPHFEKNWREIYREWLFGTYLADTSIINEFGCGTGLDLAYLAKRFPEKELHGFDWITHSKTIIDLLAKKNNWNMQGRVFDMFSPPQNAFHIKDSAVFTFSALEQLGRDFEPFLQYLLRAKPKRVVHIEHIQELFDKHNPMDNVVLAFIEERNYLRGYATSLQNLEKKGVLQIERMHRIPFGSLYIEGYSYIVWKPL